MKPLLTNLKTTHHCVVFIVCLFCASAQAQLRYATNNGAITITGYSGFDAAVVIPGTISGLPVTAVGNSAFSGAADMTSITIPDSITSIGDHAFLGCLRLANLVANGLTNIQPHAIWTCIGLTNFFIPAGLLSIGTDLFVGCSGLMSVTVDSLNPVYSSIDGVLFDKNQTTLMLCPPAKSGIYTVPDSVISIADGAFYRCKNLTRVTVGKSLTDIGQVAFDSCSNLLSVVFRGDAPANVDPTAFNADVNTILYYLPGAHGWSSTLGGRPALLWNPQASSLTISQNGLGFVISGTEGLAVVVEASETVEQGGWMPLSTNSLLSGFSTFSDPDRTNHIARFYRFRPL